jgi:hypothetical protein
MCYFEQTRWSCGYWRWGHFRQQCNKEYRMGETCGLKLVYETKVELEVCKLCHDTEKKQRRYDKMYRDVQRWYREVNRNATIERTCGEMEEVMGQIQRMRGEHGHRLQSLGQVRENPLVTRHETKGWRQDNPRGTSTTVMANMFFCVGEDGKKETQVTDSTVTKAEVNQWTLRNRV